MDLSQIDLHRRIITISNEKDIINNMNKNKYKIIKYFQGGDQTTLLRLKSFIKHFQKQQELHKGETQYFKNGRKIHIKESQKGSFTRYCGGNVTSECIARGKASPDPRIRKKATFADNARKWKHKDGGIIEPNNNYEIDYKNINVDKESLNSYSKYTFGL